MNNIPFSDAILLGSTLMRAAKGTFLTHDDQGRASGCALGMGLAGIGLLDYMNPRPRNIEADYIQFPQIRFIWESMTEPPCKCEDVLAESVQAVIVHLFDCHVFNKCDWTLERLVDWVHTQEIKALPPAPVEVMECADEVVAV